MKKKTNYETSMFGYRKKSIQGLKYVKVTKNNRLSSTHLMRQV